MLRFLYCALLFLLSSLSLSSCYFGDKFTETINCPRDAITGNIEIPFKRNSPINETFSSTLTIPKRYSVKCDTLNPVPEGKPIYSASIPLSYPDFQPGKSNFGDIKTGEILLQFTFNQTSNNWRPGPDSTYFATLISNNERHMDGDRHQFAPIKLLDGGVYYQENIRVPHLDGNASLLYYYNEKQEIGGLFYCDSLNNCEASHNDPTGQYSFRYLFKDIPIKDFPTIDRDVKQFVQKLFLQ